MFSDQSRKLIFLAAISALASGCGGSDSATNDSVDPQLATDEVIVTTASDAISADVTDGSEIEPETATETSIGIAIPVQPVSSSQMDTFIQNPLVAAIPTELSGSSSTSVSSNFMINPLVD